MAEIEVQGTTALFAANFTGVTAAGSYIKMPEVPFKAKIKGMKINDHKSEPGAKVVEIQIVATEPGYEGAERRINKRIPDATQKGRNSVKGWRTALESVGYNSAQLDTGNVLNLQGSNFLGKEGHFYHVPGNRDLDQWDDVEFITPAVYEQRKRALALQGGAKSSSVPTNGGGKAVALDVTSGAATPQPIDTAAMKANLLD